MEKEIEKIKKERDEYLDGWKRAKADFLNYKKEETERCEGWSRHTIDMFAHRFLPILDSMERAPEEMQKDKGFSQIVLQLREAFRVQGIEEVQAEGRMFDPAFHEAVQEVEIEGKEAGEIVEVLEKGYTIKEKLLRPAKVKVIK